MHKHSYAYGNTLAFSCSDEIKLPNTIYINQLDSIPSADFSYDVSFETNQNRTITLFAKDDFREEDSLNEWIFTVDKVVSFLCDNTKSQIYYVKDENYTDELMHYWLIHIVLPIYFTLNDSYYFLHTGSVNIDEKIVLFIGDSFAGKSTLTDYFLKKGHSLCSDDKLATFQKDSIFYAHTSHPYHRPYRGTEDLGIKAENFTPTTQEIGDIYWLLPVDATEPISISELKGLKKFEVLRYSTEMDIYVNKVKRFEYISRLANKLKVYEIKIPRDLEKLQEVYDAIVQHTKRGTNADI